MSAQVLSGFASASQLSPSLDVATVEQQPVCNSCRIFFAA
jgi:hypothetical protein